jgi:predicted O-methyltransferase YrrM
LSKGDSFIPLLARWFYIVRPYRVLEWGPGTSTDMMARLRPQAEIISIEHDPLYYKIAKERLGELKNVELLYLPKKKEYTNPKVKGKFDLIFVDGHSRVKCLEFAKKVLASDGVVLIHDAERKRYEKGIDLFRAIEGSCGTICLKHKM